MSIFRVAVFRFKLPPMRIFRDALRYNEINLNQENLEEYYEECAESDVFPVIVEDYALRILGGEVKYVRTQRPNADTSGSEDNPERGIPPDGDEDSGEHPDL